MEIFTGQYQYFAGGYLRMDEEIREKSNSSVRIPGMENGVLFFDISPKDSTKHGLVSQNQYRSTSARLDAPNLSDWHLRRHSDNGGSRLFLARRFGRSVELSA